MKYYSNIWFNFTTDRFESDRHGHFANYNGENIGNDGYVMHCAK